MSRAKEQPVTSAEKLVSHSDAEAIARRFINGHFKNGGRREGPRMSIPARPDQDDDLRLLAYIRQQTALAEENARLRAACEATDRARAEATWASDACPDGQKIPERIARNIDFLYLKADRLRSAALGRMAGPLRPDPRDSEIRELREALEAFVGGTKHVYWTGHPNTVAQARAALASGGGD